VDKVVFLHSVNGLRRHEAAGQLVFWACSKGGQNSAAACYSAFCTYRPVDMQRVFHKTSRNPVSAPAQKLFWPSAFGLVSMKFGDCRTMCRGGRIVETRKFFLKNSSPGLQLNAVYKMIVIVNDAPLLWIRRLSREESSVYSTDNPVYFRAELLVMVLDKIFACAKRASSSQTAPVDIKYLIHSWALDRRLRSGKLCFIELSRRESGWISNHVSPTSMA